MSDAVPYHAMAHSAESWQILMVVRLVRLEPRKGGRSAAADPTSPAKTQTRTITGAIFARSDDWVFA